MITDESLIMLEYGVGIVVIVTVMTWYLHWISIRPQVYCCPSKRNRQLLSKMPILSERFYPFLFGDGRFHTLLNPLFSGLTAATRDHELERTKWQLWIETIGFCTMIAGGYVWMKDSIRTFSLLTCGLIGTVMIFLLVMTIILRYPTIRTFLRQRFLFTAYNIDFMSEEIISYDDGNKIQLDWAYRPSCSKERLSEDAPIALVLYGFAGNAKDGYVRRLCHCLSANGMRCCVFSYWRCDYHHWKDIDAILRYIRLEKYPNCTSIKAVACSGGAQILMTYLDKCAEAAQNPLSSSKYIQPAFSSSYRCCCVYFGVL